MSGVSLSTLLNLDNIIQKEIDDEFDTIFENFVKIVTDRLVYKYHNKKDEWVLLNSDDMLETLLLEHSRFIPLNSGATIRSWEFVIKLDGHENELSLKVDNRSIVKLVNMCSDRYACENMDKKDPVPVEVICNENLNAIECLCHSNDECDGECGTSCRDMHKTRYDSSDVDCTFDRYRCPRSKAKNFLRTSTVALLFHVA